MPALNYDYDYYEYRNGQRVGKQTSVSYTRRTVNRTPNSTTVAASKRQVGTKPNAKRNTTVPRKSINAVNKKGLKKDSISKVKRKSNIDIPLETSKKIVNKPEKMSLKNANIQPKTKNSFAHALRSVAFVSIFFFLFFLVCYRYSIINEEFNNIKKMKNDLLEIETTNEQIQADIEGRTDLTYVENYAKYQLGMQKPTQSQIQYVKVEKQDKITTPIVIDDESELNWFDKLFNEIRKFVD